MDNIMRHILLQSIFTAMTLTAAVNMAAQTLQVEPLEGDAGQQATLVINLTNVATDITAMQFNLALPEGVTLDNTDITRGEVASDHELVVRTLASGDRLVLLYDMGKTLLANGTLLTLPVTLPVASGTYTGRLYTIRAATTGAVSRRGADVPFTITVKEASIPTAVTAIDAARQQSPLYNLQGIRTTKPTHPGIYIRDRKKVVGQKGQ